MTVGQLALDKKANNICILDLRSVSPVADFFVICTADAEIHAAAIADFIVKELRQEGITIRHVEGRGTSGWVIIDCNQVIIHIFLEKIREYYSLERLWGDAPKTVLDSQSA